MAPRINTEIQGIEKPSQCTREVLVEQNLLLIRLRWITVAGLVVAVMAGSHLFSVLTTTTPIYCCAALLMLCNILFFLAATKKAAHAGPRDVVLGMIQVEVDLIILTAVLHFSGGAVNPFFLFYIFPIIIATIILPRNLSFAVGLTAIILFGLLAVNELKAGAMFGYYPLQLSAEGGLWRNPVFVLGAFIAFVFTVLLARYLTRIIIVRMTAKELEAARNNDLLEAVINAMAEGLLFVTSSGKVAICNPAAKSWKLNETARSNVDAIEDFPDVLRKCIKRLLTKGYEQKTAGQVILFDTATPQCRNIEAKSYPVFGIDGEKLGYVIVGQDLTDHKKLEKELLDRTEQITAINEMLKMSRIEMAQREKMVAIGQMATGIAHEIGNPLASLSSVAQYLGRKLTTHQEKEQLLIIEYQVNRISAILKRMLTLSRPATAEYKWVDINELIDNTLALLKFDKRMRLVTVKNKPEPALPMVWLNPQLFEQVLLNIFINALDAMTAKTGDYERILHVKRQFADGMIETRITDTGIGMNPEVCRRAFESFFTTKEIGKGTGLGLFISYNLITEINGSIKLQSEPGKGTTVVIRIPIRPRTDLIGGDYDHTQLVKNVQTAEKSEN